VKLSEWGEAGLIRWLAGRFSGGSGVVRGIGDDCAVLAGPRGKWGLFACDMLVEGTHFSRQAPAGKVGWKALAINVSDVAAMGGLPKFAVVGLGLPSRTDAAWVRRFYEGMARCARKFQVRIVGGDTVRAPRSMVTVAIWGEVERKRLLLRSGARPGDDLWVTGRLGGAIRSGRHLSFIPRLTEARAIAARVPLHAMMDLSDGLLMDLPRLCRAGKVRAELELAALPRHRGVSLESALQEGEDFELLFAVSPAASRKMERWRSGRPRCGLTRIGRIRSGGRGPVVFGIDQKGRKFPLPEKGFSHFQ